MKKTMCIIAIMAAIASLFVSCGKSGGYYPEFNLNGDGQYTGFRDMKELDTIADAGPAGYVAVQGQTIKINEGLWENFLKESSAGKNASVRITYFYDDVNSFAADLFHNDGKYYIFYESDEENQSEAYDYLLVLEGTFGNQTQESKAVILTNDKSLTFEEYMNAMLSSDSEVAQSVQPSRLVMIINAE